MHHFPQRGAPLPAWQSSDPMASDPHAMEQRHDFLRQRRDAREPVEDLNALAQEWPRHVVVAAREALGPDLARVDLAVPAIEVAVERGQRVVRCATTSPRAGGRGRVARRLSRHPQGEHAVCPRALRAGLRAGSWTPLAAKPATWVVAHVTPQEGAARLALWGNLTPAKSPRDRWPHALQSPGESPTPPGCSDGAPPGSPPA